ncbi:MAG TPA: hypothetical protein VN922_10395, partial [Bacteroidia bacterium]|nr:hypothetical protein [Bacteroidia bacterium]
TNGNFSPLAESVIVPLKECWAKTPIGKNIAAMQIFAIEPLMMFIIMQIYKTAGKRKGGKFPG